MINIDNHVRGDTLNIAFSIQADTVIDLASDDVAFTFSVKRNITDTGYLVHKDKSAVEALGDNSFMFRIAPEDTADLTTLISPPILASYASALKIAPYNQYAGQDAKINDGNHTYYGDGYIYLRDE